MPALLPLILASASLSAPAAAPVEEHSYAQTDRVRVKALALELDANFKEHKLSGYAELALTWKDPAARTLVLDTRDLAIDHVTCLDAKDTWQPATFALAKSDPAFGSKLTIDLKQQAPKVRVYYATSPKAAGLQWLDPAQTLGKKTPFMFSQSEAIQARSWVPLQDTPSVRFTYQAHVTAPKGLRVVMSAENDAQATGEGGFRLAMPQPIPSYLLAIAIGELEYRPLGKRTGVYAEPGRIEAAAKEFADTEHMVEVTESLYGPYRWGRYELLVLPPSFPFGGMENPRLTFATPTVIAGDKSLVALVAHELAHSWSGNLVTNAGWEHFWLNEGFTTYVENRIVEALYGRDQALMQQHIDQTELMADELKKLPPNDQKLVPDMHGRDPDDAYSTIPYTKGAWMLRTIEQRVGRDVFDPFVRGWFDSHAFGSVTTDDFLAYLDQHLLKEHPDAISKEELNQWLHEPGLPAAAKVTASTKLEAVDAATKDWLAGKRSAADLGGKRWSTQEWQHFLNSLPADLTLQQVESLDAAYALTKTGNSEIAYRWFLVAIRANYEPARPALRAYLLAIGRRKLVVPLYEELAKTPENLAWARTVFAEAKPGYHPMTSASVAQKLKLGSN